MRTKLFASMLLICLAVVQTFVGCKDELESTIVKGIVKNNQGETVFPAFIIFDNKLLATTNESGAYQINTLNSGNYSLICSAIGYDDKIIEVNITDGKTTTTDIVLTPNENIGWIYGEFQDKSLFEQHVESDPEKKDWDAKKILDAVSGATIQPWKMSGVSECEVNVGDELIATGDGYGQYWIELQCGTYPFTGTCSGYRDTTVIIKIEQNTELYYNLILLKQ